MASASYAQLVAKTSSLLFDHEDLKGIITAAKAGDMLAVLDRNELEGEWRNARLLRLEDTNEEVQWRLAAALCSIALHVHLAARTLSF